MHAMVMPSGVGRRRHSHSSMGTCWRGMKTGRRTLSFGGCAVTRPFAGAPASPSFSRAAILLFLSDAMCRSVPTLCRCSTMRNSNHINRGCGQPLHQRPINGTIDRRKGASADLSRVVEEWFGHVIPRESRSIKYDWPTQSASYHGTLLNTRVPRQASYD